MLREHNLAGPDNRAGPLFASCQRQPRLALWHNGAMPEYVYRNVDEIACEHCREPFSVRQPLGEPPLTICPRCGAAIQRAVVPVYGGVKQGGQSLERRAKRAGFQVLRKDDSGDYKPT